MWFSMSLSESTIKNLPTIGSKGLLGPIREPWPCKSETIKRTHPWNCWLKQYPPPWNPPTMEVWKVFFPFLVMIFVQSSILGGSLWTSMVPVLPVSKKKSRLLSSNENSRANSLPKNSCLSSRDIFQGFIQNGGLEPFMSARYRRDIQNQTLNVIMVYLPRFIPPKLPKFDCKRNKH